MKQKTDYYCKGCATEITIFGIMGKETQIFCKTCRVSMYEVEISRQKALKSKKGVSKT